jgi:hypothetical protein
MPVNVRHYKKYANRKFYDLDRGRYVSLLDIGDVIAGGEEIQASCDRTGRDLTFETLARTLCERTKAYFAPAAKRGKTADEPVSRDFISRIVRLIPAAVKPAKRPAR